ncbi:MAG TPA: hypothetical protein VK629_03425 [Steroidobacteraceae bacterium]|nr:hypothetical protein [Steroidobacteraceae bacterium]
MKSLRKATPASRPLRLRKAAELQTLFATSLQEADGLVAAHCVHELWMRGEMAMNIESMLERLWKACAESVPPWLPMRHIECLSTIYAVALRSNATRKGRSNVYLVLLDYSDRADRRGENPYGVYVGMSHYSAEARFNQHKAGIRAAGSVLKRGIEPLVGPVMHLQKIHRAEATRIEIELAEALQREGLIVEGGH